MLCLFNLKNSNTIVFEGDDCDDDQDNDLINNVEDNCPLVANTGQEHVQRTYDVKGEYEEYQITINYLEHKVSFHMSKMNIYNIREKSRNPIV